MPISAAPPVADPIYALSLPTKDDIAQENKLAELEGRKPHSFHRSASYQPREYGYGLAPAHGADMFAPPIPDPAVVDKLIEWVVAQERKVALAVFEYLEEPGDETLKNVCDLVAVEVEAPEPRKPGKLSDLVWRALPATLSDLYSLARAEHASRRPEAAVRQTLRNMQKRDLVYTDEQGVVRIQDAA